MIFSVYLALYFALNISGLNGRQILRAISLSYPGFNLIQPNTYNIIPWLGQKEICEEYYTSIFLDEYSYFSLRLLLVLLLVYTRLLFSFGSSSVRADFDHSRSSWTLNNKNWKNSHFVILMHEWLSHIVYGCFQPQCV